MDDWFGFDIDNDGDIDDADLGQHAHNWADDDDDGDIDGIDVGRKVVKILIMKGFAALAKGILKVWF